MTVDEGRLNRTKADFWNAFEVVKYEIAVGTDDDPFRVLTRGIKATENFAIRPTKNFARWHVDHLPTGRRTAIFANSEVAIIFAKSLETYEQGAEELSDRCKADENFGLKFKLWMAILDQTDRTPYDPALEPMVRDWSKE